MIIINKKLLKMIATRQKKIIVKGDSDVSIYY
mgnify:CR=1 FL=1